MEMSLPLDTPNLLKSYRGKDTSCFPNFYKFDRWPMPKLSYCVEFITKSMQSIAPTWTGMIHRGETPLIWGFSSAHFCATSNWTSGIAGLKEGGPSIFTPAFINACCLVKSLAVTSGLVLGSIMISTAPKKSKTKRYDRSSEASSSPSTMQKIGVASNMSLESDLEGRCYMRSI